MLTLIYMRSLAIIVAIAIAGILVYKDIEGWGWFLFVAVLLGQFSFSKTD